MICVADNQKESESPKRTCRRQKLPMDWVRVRLTYDRSSPRETRVGHRSAERSSARFPLIDVEFAEHLTYALWSVFDCLVSGLGSPTETRGGHLSADRSSVRFPSTDSGLVGHSLQLRDGLASGAETMLPHTGCGWRLRKCCRQVACVSVNLGQRPSVSAARETCEVVHANTRRCEQS